MAEYLIIRRGKYVFEVPVIKPTGYVYGYRVDPTDVRIARGSGVVYVPRWVTQNAQHTHFKLIITVVDTVRAAIRQCQHITGKYEKESADFRKVCDEVRWLNSIYLSWNPMVTVADEHRISQRLVACDVLFGLKPRRPEKVIARGQLRTVATTGVRDRTGRVNPSSRAARLFNAIYQLEELRLPSDRVIAGHVAGRAVGLEQVMLVNKGIFRSFENGIDRLLKDPWFQTPEVASDYWYGKSEMMLRQLRVLIQDRIWGKPYCLVESCLIAILDVASNLLWQHRQQLVAQKLCELKQALTGPPREAAKFKRSLVSLQRSATWKERDPEKKHSQKAQTALEQLIDFPKFDDTLVNNLWLPIRSTVKEAVRRTIDALKFKDWEKADQLLDRAIDRCEW